ncbi:hypothetical protein Q8W71_05990 [Methylobacterium sp. NEAU 140]|nr:hypothetical protein [Methylobacterium sp. NEAU 140]MDP4022164.1 hypothetical protein [Methylobacterium sp. NEAU 140]
MPPHPRHAAVAPRASLFSGGAGPRLALAAGLSGLVWLAIAWALSA